MLRNAVDLLSMVLRRGDRVSDADYLSLGKRANIMGLERAEKALVDGLREADSLGEVLEVPFALQRVEDLRATMQLAVAKVGEVNDDLLRSSDFHPVFIAFSYGFAVGIIAGHRARAAGVPVAGLPKRTLEQCEQWGAIVALCYLVSVESMGIFDKATDRVAYAIEDQWQSAASVRLLEPIDTLRECVDFGRELGERWSLDDSVELHGPFMAALDRDAVLSGA
jgi:hypothetical protein